MIVNMKWYNRLIQRLLVLAMLFVALVPVYIVVSNSFRRALDIKRMPPELIFTPIWTHYDRVLSVDNFARYFLNSLIIAGTTTIAVILLGTLAAYGLRLFKSRLGVRLSNIMMLGKLVPSITILIPLFIMLNRLQLTGKFISPILAHAAISVPFVTWLMRGFIEDIPTELLESATEMGATRMKTFFYIVLPMLMPAVASAVILTMQSSWNEIVAAASHDRPFYQVELQGGGGKAGLLCGEVPTARDVRLWNYLHIAAGGKGVTYWQYAPEPAGIESPGFGLTGFQGENTERSNEAGRCARELKSDVLALAKRVPAQNAIYLSRDNSLWFYGAGREEALYAQAIHGFYQAAYLAGIPITFAHQDRVHSLYEDGVRTLLLPMPIVLSEDETDMLAAFVKQGGTLVSEACAGLYDETGKLDQSARALKQLFGLTHIELQGLGEQEHISARNASATLFTGMLYRQVVTASKNVSVKAVFHDGHPALTERKLGKGKAIFIASLVALANARQQNPNTEQLLRSYLHLGGYPQFKWIRVNPLPDQLDPPRLAPVVRLLETDDQYIITIVNPLHTGACISIGLTEPWQNKTQLQFDLAPSDGTFMVYQK